VRVAYIVSMAKSGMTAWNYREISILREQGGVEVDVYVTKWTEGPNMPEPAWVRRRPGLLRTLALQPGALLRWPGRYVRGLLEALKHRCVPEFLLAADFSHDLAARRPAHLHCHFGDRKLITGYFCSKFLDLPLSVTVHAYEILMNPNPAMFRRAAARCRTVVTVSQFNRRELVERFGVPDEKIQVHRIHGDLSDGSAAGKVKLLIVAEYREKKGHAVLFEALRRLGRQDLVLWVVGGGDLDVPALAAEAGVADQVVFMGQLGRRPLQVLLDACDLFVLPSRTAANGDREGIPVALMEAMSHGKPVISTHHVGIPELVEEILVPENDPAALADAIARLADDPALRRAQGERNRAIVTGQFGADAVLGLRAVFAGEGPPAPAPGEPGR